MAAAAYKVFFHTVALLHTTFADSAVLSLMGFGMMACRIPPSDQFATSDRLDYDLGQGTNSFGLLRRPTGISSSQLPFSPLFPLKLLTITVPCTFKNAC